MNTTIQSLYDYLINADAQQLVLLTDERVHHYYAHYLDEVTSHFDAHTMVVPAGESSKSIEQATRLWQQLLDYRCERNAVLLNFGGGMVCDLGGFVAATYKRGIRCINYPTTLLAMIDAAIGGKTAVNLQYVKNCVGLIRQPDWIAPADVSLLKTLPHQELMSGFGELVKYALIALPDLFAQLCQLEKVDAAHIRPEWIEQCVRYKEHLVSIDPNDYDERQVLNFGHTYGHPVESMYASQGNYIPHGVAVAIGMAYECLISLNEGCLPKDDYLKIMDLLNRHFEIPPFTDALQTQLQPYMVQDKKNRNGKVCFRRLHTIGKIGK